MKQTCPDDPKQTNIAYKILGACLVLLLLVLAIVVANNEYNKAATHVPRQSFVLLKVTTTVELKDCIEPTNMCQSNKAYPETWDPTMVHKGSGLVISHVDDNSYIITAAHVCKNKVPKRVTIDGLKYTVNVNRKIEVFDYSGNNHITEVVHYDHHHDMCILKSKGVWGQAITVASHMPERGDRVLNLAAPYGIYSPKMVLTFEGFYSGTDHLGNEIYTIPAAPGSSGSPIFNEKGELISIIHSAAYRFENIAIGCKLENLREFIESYVSRKQSFWDNFDI